MIISTFKHRLLHSDTNRLSNLFGSLTVKDAMFNWYIWFFFSPERILVRLFLGRLCSCAVWYPSDLSWRGMDSYVHRCNLDGVFSGWSHVLNIPSSAEQTIFLLLSRLGERIIGNGCSQIREESCRITLNLTILFWQFQFCASFLYRMDSTIP